MHVPFSKFTATIVRILKYRFYLLEVRLQDALYWPAHAIWYLPRCRALDSQLGHRSSPIWIYTVCQRGIKTISAVKKADEPL